MTPQSDPALINCANCQTPMPRELRFCRNCGFRLGEGVAEYTETVRFQNVPPGAAPGNNAAAFNQFGAANAQLSAYPAGGIRKRKKRLSGMSWIFIGLLIFFIAAAGFSAIFRPIRQNIQTEIGARVQRSYAGVNAFDTTDGGVTFEYVYFPGSPADRAGLVGGDVITTFDGKTVRTDDEIMDLLGSIPIGKTVDVIYIRDGETKTTKLTTISKEEHDRMLAAYRERPRARFGYDDDNSERVQIPNSNLFGVRLDEISPSLPADMAGIKQGDIVIEFGGVPIRTPEELSFRVRSATPYETVKVVVMRDGQRLEIPVKMGRLS